jgi:hypothetical protein
MKCGIRNSHLLIAFLHRTHKHQFRDFFNSHACYHSSFTVIRRKVLIVKRAAIALCVVLLLATLAAFAQNDRPLLRRSEYPTPTIREEQEVLVDGVTETWRLQWKSMPTPYCGADVVDVSLTCPCIGFAYGESGDLYLIRLRSGIEVEQLRLTPLFGEYPNAVVQRWPADYAKDFALGACPSNAKSAVMATSTCGSRNWKSQHMAT